MKPGASIIDIGCGTGGFASDLMQDGFNVIGLDTSETALKYAKKRGINELHQTTLDKFPKNRFKLDAACALDVIEHIKDDKAFLADVASVLDAGSWFIATVPAYQWLWSKHDEVHMHFRRYTKNEISSLIENAGFKIKYATYFNSFLFLPAVLKRFKDKLTGAEKKQTEPVEEVSESTNKALHKIFASEKNVLPNIKFPFGLSILVIAKKKTNGKHVKKQSYKHDQKKYTESI